MPPVANGVLTRKGPCALLFRDRPRFRRGGRNGDGRGDLLARRTSTGTLYLYPGKGVGFAPRISLGTGWSGRRDLVGVGDFNRDGRPDVTAIDSATGTLYLYPGKTGGLSARIRLSGGWSGRGPLL